MRFIDRAGRPEPASWTRVSRDSRYGCYRDLDATEEGRQARSELRTHMARTQRGLCAYCCCRISGGAEDTHNEHVAPEGRFAQRSLDYGNLVASCNRQKSCGTFKGDAFDERSFVSPLQAGCERHFRYRPDGVIEGVTDEGKATVEALNLNDYGLRDARKNLIVSYLSWADADIMRVYCQPDGNGDLAPFVDMVEQLCADGVF